MNYFLIINPRSRNERNRWRIRGIIDKCGIRGMDFNHVFVSSYETIRAESEYANRKGYDAVIAVGGDGTINAVINGFYDYNGNRISRSRFGVIYTGTSPDFCKSYGIPLDEDKAISVLTDPRIRQIRAGMILFRKEEDSVQTENRIFACCANIGLGAGVASVSNKIRKYTGDFAGTLFAVLWNLAADGSRRLVVSVDKTTTEIPRVTNISAGRTKFIASGIKVHTGISDDDDRFYLILVKNISLNTLPRLLYQVYSGNLTTTEILDLKYGRYMEFQSPDRPAGVEFDGDPAGFCPCMISLAPDPLDLIVYEG